jgi:hypothetical protein
MADKTTPSPKTADEELAAKIADAIGAPTTFPKPIGLLGTIRCVAGVNEKAQFIPRCTDYRSNGT